MEQEVMCFISRFTMNGKYDQVEETFTCGCCFWFALILHCRFAGRSTVMYDEVENHFATEIAGRIYDITGDVTEKYDMEPWDNMDDSLLKGRIVRDCILF